MFWQNYLNLCNERGISPNKAARDVGVKSSGSVTGWKNGVIPRQNVLVKLAEYFNCSVEDLVGNKKTPTTTISDGSKTNIGINVAVISEKDIRLLSWFRSLSPEKQKAILISQDAPEGLV